MKFTEWDGLPVSLKTTEEWAKELKEELSDPTGPATNFILSGDTIVVADRDEEGIIQFWVCKVQRTATVVPWEET